MNANRSLKRVVHIYREGDTEECYLRAACNDRYSGIRVDYKPVLKGKLKRIMQNLEQDVKRLPTNSPIDVFVVFDMDVLHRDGLIDQYNEMKEKLCGVFPNIYFIESMPCIEFWFLLHFLYTDRYMLLCEIAEQELDQPNCMPGYSKTKKYQNNVYNSLKDKTDNATINAKKILKKSRVKGERYSYTMMHQFFERMDDVIQ